MTSADLLDAMRERLRTYWRMRVALALALQYPPGETIKFEQVPTTPRLGALLDFDNIGSAMKDLQAWSTMRLESEFLLLMITNIEHFLSLKLVVAGLKGEGTLGHLQAAAEKTFGITGNEVLLFSEIRERRNAIIHHDGKATVKHVASVTAAIGLSAAIDSVSLGDDVRPSPGYLTHAGDAIAAYGSRYP